MNVSVVISSLNEENHIEHLLTDLSNQTKQPKEIIVVDGNSVDSTQKIVKTFPNVILFTMSPQVAAQRTRGGNIATSELLIFMDADVRVKKDFCKNVQESFMKKKLHIACPQYVPSTGNIIIQGVYLVFNFIFYLFQKVRASGAGSCIIVTKELFQKIGGFNPDYRFDDIAFIRAASYKGNFAILAEKIYVSPRRFVQKGAIKQFFIYLLLSVFFFFDAFKAANIISYDFDIYRKK